MTSKPLIDLGYRQVFCPKCKGAKFKFTDYRLQNRRCLKCGYIVQSIKEMTE